MSLFFHMKNLFLFLILSTSAIAAPLGAKIINKDARDQAIYLECDSSSCTHAVFAIEKGEEKKLASAFTVPMGNELDPYQERWGIFNDVLTEASIRMPPVPEFRYLYLMNTATKAYREAFKQIETTDKSGTAVEMKGLFFGKLVESLER